MYCMKRSFDNIRSRILSVLNKSEMTKMEIAMGIKADYRTVERHLIWLIGTEVIKKINKNKNIYYKLK